MTASKRVPVAWYGTTFPPEFDFELDTWNGLRWNKDGDPVMATLAPPVTEHTTEALWPTGCPGCFGPIRPGDVIGLVDGDWLCSGCFE